MIDRVFVDTSVWIAYLRGENEAVRVELDRMLDADTAVIAVPVRIELLAGAKAKHRSQLQRLLGGLLSFLPNASTWQLIEEWVTHAKAAGDHFGMADLLIAAIAAENHGSLWSIDGDFPRMERFGLVRLHHLP